MYTHLPALDDQAFAFKAKLRGRMPFISLTSSICRLVAALGQRFGALDQVQFGPMTGK
jgi:hypothetical protein